MFETGAIWNNFEEHFHIWSWLAKPKHLQDSFFLRLGKKLRNQNFLNFKEKISKLRNVDDRIKPWCHLLLTAHLGFLILG